MDDKIKGRRDAVAILAKAKKPAPAPPEKPEPLDLSLISKAITALAEKQPDYAKQFKAIEASLKTLKPEALDLGPVIAAINKLEITSSVDLRPLANAVAELEPANLKVIEGELKALRRATEKHNEILQNLLDLASKPKQVKYDSEGRITEIGIKK